MPMYQVGEPYSASSPNKLYPEGHSLVYYEDGFMLTGFLNQPTSAEIQDYKTGFPQFALLEGKTCLILCLRMGGQPWSDASWQAYRQVPGKGLPEPGVFLMLTLCDARGGIIKTLRAYSLTPEFSAGLHRAVSRLTDEAASPQVSDAELDHLMQYPTDELVDMAQFRN